jgi:uncharacterized protein (DUF4415 family)
MALLLKMQFAYSPIRRIFRMSSGSRAANIGGKPSARWMAYAFCWWCTLGRIRMVSISSASFPPERLNDMKDDATKTKIVRYEFDPTNPPPLTDEQRKRLRALDDLKDEDIDTSDIPPLTEKFWFNAVRFRDRHLYKAVKKQVTVRLDADVLEYFKAKQDGKRGYQTAINAALRKVVEDEMRKR